MGAGHGHRLHFHGHAPVHRAPAHLKLLALVGFMLVVVATPREWYAAFGGLRALLLLAVIARRGVPADATSRKRMVIEVPFVLFALLVPFIADGPRIEVLGLSRLRAGPARPVSACWSRARSACSPRSRSPRPPSRRTCCADCERLRMPDLIVQIMGFMIRYLDVVTGELGRMMVAMRSRGCDPRSPRHWPTLARAHRRAVHPLLRARRAGAPRDALARVRRDACPRRADR